MNIRDLFSILLIPGTQILAGGLTLDSEVVGYFPVQPTAEETNALRAVTGAEVRDGKLVVSG